MTPKQMPCQSWHASQAGKKPAFFTMVHHAFERIAPRRQALRLQEAHAWCIFAPRNTVKSARMRRQQPLAFVGGAWKLSPGTFTLIVGVALIVAAEYS